MTKHAKLGTLFAAAALTMSIAACSSASGQDKGASADADGKTIVIDKSFDLKTADPGRQFEPTGSIVGVALYDTLLTYKNGDSSTPIPSLATKWSANDKATEFTFTLRSDVVFSDGTPLTAEDVVFSLNRVANLKANGSHLMAGLVCEKVDGSTVKLVSEAPNSAVPAIVTSPTLGIVNSSLVKKNGGTDGADAATADTAEKFLNTTSAGSGAYTLQKWDTTTETVLVANPKYWGTKPTYGKVVLRNAQPETQALDVQSGKSGLAMDMGPDQIEAVRSDQKIKVSETASSIVFFVLLNTDPAISKVTGTPEFREAVKYGIDYAALMELAGSGAARSAGIIPGTLAGALPANEAPTRDIAKAKAAVAKLGSNTSVKLEYASDLAPNGVALAPIAERIQANLTEVGLKIELVPTPTTTALDNYRAGKEQMGLWYWNPDFPDPSNYLEFGPGGIVGKRANWNEGDSSQLTKLMGELRVMTDDAQRVPKYQDYQRELNKAGVFIPLFQPAAALASTAEVGPVTYSPPFLLDVRGLGAS